MAVREEKWNVDKPTQNNSRFRDGSKMKKTLRRNKENTSKLYVIGNFFFPFSTTYYVSLFTSLITFSEDKVLGKNFGDHNS
jgi:hypothetical protein